MSVIRVTRQELEEANLTYLLVETHAKMDYVLEVYIWDTREWPATLCLLAGIGEILG